MTRLVSLAFSTLKWLLAIVGVLVLGLIFFRIYHGYVDDRAYRNSALIKELDRIERENGNVLDVLFTKDNNIGEYDSRLVTRWLQGKELRGDAPYLYLMALYYGKQKYDYAKLLAVAYHAKAGLIYRIDAIRCSDTTATQAIWVMETALGVEAVRNALRKNPWLRDRLVKSALIFEEENASRPRPMWICKYGHNPTDIEPDEAARRAHRDSIRDQFAKSF